jgi:hypothetical protein
LLQDAGVDRGKLGEGTTLMCSSRMSCVLVMPPV